MPWELMTGVELKIYDSGVEHLGVDNLGVDNLGIDDLGVNHLGVDDLGIYDLEVDELGVDDLEIQELGVDDLRVHEMGEDDLGTRRLANGRFCREITFIAHVFILFSCFAIARFKATKRKYPCRFHYINLPVLT